MTRKKCIWAIAITCLFGRPLRAQTPTVEHIDSLNHIWQMRGKVPDSTRLQAVTALQRLYYTSADDESLLLLSNAVYEEANIRSNKRWMAQGLYGFGMYQRVNGNPDSSRYFFQRAIACLHVEEAPELYSNMLFSIGTEWSKGSNLDSAIYYLQLTLDIKKAWRLPTDMVYLNIAATYQDRGQFSKAFEYFDLAKTSKDPYMVANAVTNSSYILMDLGLIEEARENMAIAVGIADSFGDVRDKIKAYSGMICVAPNLQAVGYWLNKANSIGSERAYGDDRVYLLYHAIRQYMDSLDYAKAKPLLAECLALSTERGIPQIISNNKLSLAKIACSEKRPREALALCRSVKPYFLQENSAYNLEYLFQVMYDASEQLGNRDSAYFYLKLKDMYATENAKQDFKVKALLEYVKSKTKQEKEALLKAKESAEALAKETQERQMLSYWLFGAISLLLGSTALFWFSHYRRKKRTEEALARANQHLLAEREKLERSNEKLRRFSGIVSHDILNNLDLNLSAGNVLVGPHPKFESLVQYYQITQNTNKHLKNYCLQLLETARGDTPIGLNDPMPILETVLQRFSPTLKQTGFQVNLGQLSPTHLPPAAMEQLFQNLVSNALRHGGSATDPTLAIYETHGQKGYLQWVVEDNGRGVPTAQRDDIFDGPKGKASGTSGNQIGLTLLRKTLEEYGANISVEQGESGGAKWVVAMCP